MLADLLEQPDVREELTLRSAFGFMAYHGGSLEKTTDIVARDAARRAGASYYGVVQSDDEPTHVASTDVHPDASTRLRAFLDHVQVVATVHGYGRDHLRRCVLLGGRNRALAHHVAAHLRPRLPGFSFRTDLATIPSELAGQHRRNPVNVPPDRGVQIELPPVLRWNHAAWGWSDHAGTARAPQIEQLIEALAGAARTWPLRA